jgi:predicted enzyme involved in methoxymalonyl-ACP biosynthesis
MSLVDQIKQFIEMTGFGMAYYMQDTQEEFVPNSQVNSLDQQTVDSLLDMSTAFGGIRFYSKNIYNSATTGAQQMFDERSLYEYISTKQSFNMNNTFLLDSEVISLANAMSDSYAQEIIDSIGDTGSDASQLSEDVYNIVLAKTV